MKPTLENFGASCRRRRIAVDATQQQVADLAEISRPHYSLIENGHVENFGNLTRVAIERALAQLERKGAVV